MKLYVGTKVVQARPMGRSKFSRVVRLLGGLPEEGDLEGYYIRYPDGYESWSPASTFATSYREVTVGELILFEESDGHRRPRGASCEV